jgi:hypothetical protein
VEALLYYAVSGPDTPIRAKALLKFGQIGFRLLNFAMLLTALQVSALPRDTVISTAADDRPVTPRRLCNTSPDSA